MRLEFARPWVRFPAGLRCVFSSDPAVNFSIFVGAERVENSIRNDPDKSEFTHCDVSNRIGPDHTTCDLQVFPRGFCMLGLSKEASSSQTKLEEKKKSLT